MLIATSHLKSVLFEHLIMIFLPSFLFLDLQFLSFNIKFHLTLLIFQLNLPHIIIISSEILIIIHCWLSFQLLIFPFLGLIVFHHLLIFIALSQITFFLLSVFYEMILTHPFSLIPILETYLSFLWLLIELLLAAIKFTDFLIFLVILSTLLLLAFEKMNEYFVLLD